MSRERAAGRISAYVYGNILIVAALLSLHPDDLSGPKGLAYVGGTALSTFVAYVVAEFVRARIRDDRLFRLRIVLHESRDAMPIVSAATTPLLLLGAALLGSVDADLALRLAVGTTALRMAGLGWAMGRVGRQRPSRRTFFGGVLLAGACLTAAFVKWWLTH